VLMSELNTLANDKAVKIWSPFTGELIRNLNGHTKGLSDIAWSADSVYLASASDDHTIRLWDVDSVSSRLSMWCMVYRLTFEDRGLLRGY
jgi:WD40 repeat protein